MDSRTGSIFSRADIPKLNTTTSANGSHVQWPARRGGRVPIEAGRGKATPGGFSIADCQLPNEKCSAMRLKITIAYDGTPYKGVAESAILVSRCRIRWRRRWRGLPSGGLIVHACSRTASRCACSRADVLRIDVDPSRSAEEWRRLINFNLPPSIQHRSLQRGSGVLRFAACFPGKICRYIIRNTDIVLPHEYERVWMVPDPLDIKLLRAAAAMFVGEHNFRGFGANREEPTQTVRTISSLGVAQWGSCITLTFTGPGFLYRMVRIVPGSIIRVRTQQGRHRGNPPPAPRSRKSHLDASRSAGGLCLMKVIY